jgi:SAM-dependent methyltransferase
MKTTDNKESTGIKEMVKDAYSRIALQDKQTNESGCCGATGCCDTGSSIMADDYSKLDGYNPDADLGLGCGLPTEYAHIRPGDIVIDLGSGAGNDAFVARHQTGEAGKVIGVDFSPVMIAKARENAEKRGFLNVEFREGDIEHLPVSSGMANVVVSNCVLNLVPSKESVFKEINRVLKSGGHFSISDVVLVGELPAKLRSVAELYAGCITGAIQKDEYLDIINRSGFGNVVVQKEKPIVIPDDLLREHLSEEEIQTFRASGTGIFSITVFAKKDDCCKPGTGCC